MKTSTLLIVATMISIVLSTWHLADDIVHGWEPGTLGNLYALPIFVVWLYGTLVLRDRVSGCIIMLVGSLLALGLPIIHMSGRGIGATSRVANTSGYHFFVWTLITLGVTGLFSLVLSVQILWARRTASRRAPAAG
ncbi:MAG TPA: hypothetical protein VFA59_02060 [Vicinamibacterales bacterium]|nr:hypothetical protein [Vicinamibacterales bacterium]